MTQPTNFSSGRVQQLKTPKLEAAGFDCQYQESYGPLLCSLTIERMAAFMH
jgi:hypothetical protein